MKRLFVPLAFVVVCLLSVSILPGFRSLANDDDGSRDKDAPKTVARLDLANQSSEIPVTTLFTPEKDGLYRISGYVVGLNNGNPGGSIDGRFSWTDDSGVQGYTPHSIEGLGGGGFGFARSLFGLGIFSSCNFVLHAKANTPITFETDGFDGAGNPIISLGDAKFSAFLTVEKL